MTKLFERKRRARRIGGAVSVVASVHVPLQGLARRARIVLAVYGGRVGWNKEIAVRLEASADTAMGKWRRRYAAEGLDGLVYDEPRPGAPRQIGKISHRPCVSG